MVEYHLKEMNDISVFSTLLMTLSVGECRCYFLFLLSRETFLYKSTNHWQMAVIESTTDGILCDVSIKPQTVSASFLSMKSTSANLLGTMEKYCSYPP